MNLTKHEPTPLADVFDLTPEERKRRRLYCIFRDGLVWPMGRPRTPAKDRTTHKRYSVSLKDAFDDLEVALDLFAHDSRAKPIVTADLPGKRNGRYRTTAESRDPGVAVYVDKPSGPLAIACDKFWLLRDNVRAIWQIVESLRTIERVGAEQMTQQAYRGFAALPEHADGGPWHAVFNLPSNASMMEVNRAYRELARLHHPDNGGSHDAMARLNRALAEAREELDR